MRAKKRQPARFDVVARSSVFKNGKIVWKVVVDSDAGMVATRQDGRRVAIDWERMIGAAMFYGHDSVRKEVKKGRASNKIEAEKS